MRKSKEIKSLKLEIDILKINVERLEAMMSAVLSKKQIKDESIDSGKWYKESK